MTETRNLPDEAIPVGVLYARTGAMAVTEQAQLQGTLLAIDEINASGGIGGRPLMPVIEDPASDPALYRDLARRMLVRDQVPAIFGCCSSASRKAVLPLIERHGAILFYGSPYEGFEYSPNVIYTGATPSQTIVPLVEYLFARHGRRIYLVGSDYVFPREVNRITREFLTESGGVALGEDYIAQGAGAAAFRTVAAKIRVARPDVVLSTVVGGDTARFHEICHALGATTAERPIASLTACEGELQALAPQVRAGHITVSPYFAGLDTPENATFSALFRSRYGAASIPSVYSETAYAQVHLFARAAANAGDIDPDLILQLLRGERFLAPQGEILVDPDTNHLHLRPRIGRVGADGGFELVWEAAGPVAPDPYLVAYHRRIAG